MRADKVYLVGFMAVGKSSLAKALGDRLEWQTEDVDERIEAREHMGITDIFRTHGEPYFRSVERQVLAELLPLRPAVIATGGGTFVDPDNRALINGNGASVWLDTPLVTVISRLPPDNRRPLAADLAQLERLYAVRRAAYGQAHLRLDASRAPLGELVERMLDWLGP